MYWLLSIIGAISAYKRQHWIKDWRYEDLGTTPFLYDTEYLEQLYDKAKDKEQKGMVWEHIYTRSGQSGGFGELLSRYENEYRGRD